MDFFNQVIDFFYYISDFLVNGIWQLVYDAIVYIVAKVTILYFEIKIFMLGFAADVATEILDELNITSLIQQKIDLMNAQYTQLIMFLRLPEMINMIMSSYLTRYVFRFIGI